MFEELTRPFVELDILVQVAGVIHEAPLLETDVDAFDRVDRHQPPWQLSCRQGRDRADARSAEGRVILTAYDPRLSRARDLLALRRIRSTGCSA